MTDTYDEDIKHRVELTPSDNDGVFITSCEKNVREDISIGSKIDVFELHDEYEATKLIV
jgi:hypothetical protein